MKQGMTPGWCGTALTVEASLTVLEVVREMSGATEVEPSSELIAELGFDSLGLIELLAVLEDTLDLPSVDMGALSSIVRVADLQGMVQEAQAATMQSGGPK